MNHQAPPAIQRMTLIAAWSISLVIALTAPVAYYLVSRQHLELLLKSQADLAANDIMRIVAANPKMWRYEEVRLNELLRRRVHDGIPEEKRILDTTATEIATNGVNAPGPVVSRTDDIYDAGTVVARVTVSRSLRPLLFHASLVALCSSSVATILFFILRSLPLRIIRNTYQTLAESEKKYRLLYETMKEGMALHRVEFDDKGDFHTLTVIDANPSCAAMFKDGMERVIGGNSFALFGDTLREFLSELLRIMEHGDTISFELRLPGTEDYYLVQAFSPDHGLIATLFENITERRQSEHRIQQMAYFDTLTGLPNRALFLDRLNQAIARSIREKSILAVLFLDLDRFKIINDTLGHAAGDQLLIEVSQRLNRHLRASDTLARLGGDEFVAVVTNLDNRLSSSTVAQSLIDALHAPILIKGNELHITTSIGIALYPDDGDNAHTLIKHADMAMYSSKEAGRNAFSYYSPFMNERAVMRMEIETGLRNALDRDEFFLEFQPIVDIRTGEIVAAEALVRWNHPTRGRVPPDQFISLAEETGLILPLGEWVLYKVCRIIRAWSDNGFPPVRVSVNVSSRQVEQQKFAEIVKNALRDTGAPTAQLELELSESCLAPHTGGNISAVLGMREWGVFISIDDFGTGNSSLSYIRKLPIDHLKIDRTFVKDMGSSAYDRAIVETIISLSRKLGVRNVAEGVETAAQVRLLKEMGCDEAQGFYYYPPISRGELEILLRKQGDVS